MGLVFFCFLFFLTFCFFFCITATTITLSPPESNDLIWIRINAERPKVIIKPANREKQINSIYKISFFLTGIKVSKILSSGSKKWGYFAFDPDKQLLTKLFSPSRNGNFCCLKILNSKSGLVNHLRSLRLAILVLAESQPHTRATQQWLIARRWGGDLSRSPGCFLFDWPHTRSALHHNHLHASAAGSSGTHQRVCS